MQKQNDATELFKILNGVQPLGSKETKNTIETYSDKIKKWLLLTAAILFVILLLLVGVQRFIFELPYAIKYMALVITCMTMLLPVVAMLIDIFLGVFQLVKFKTETFRILMLEVQHDKSNIDMVVKFERKVLVEVKSWLEVKCSRIKAKIGVFFGGSEKIALISLAGFGWITFKEVFNGKIPENLPSASVNPTQFTIVLIVAFFTGLSIGAMLLNQQLRRYTYHMEILDMALKKKPE